MNKIFFADKKAFKRSQDAVHFALSQYFGIDNAVIKRNENGKPFVQTPTTAPFFSVSHTSSQLFLAFSSQNIGIDVESLGREINYLPIVKKFTFDERQEIASKEDFLRHWTVKESVIKWIGGSIAHDLHKIAYVNNKIQYGNFNLPIHLLIKETNGLIFSICSENELSDIDLEPLLV